MKSGLRNQLDTFEEKKKVLLDGCKKLEILKEVKNKELDTCRLSSKEILDKQRETEKKLNELESTMDTKSE